MADAPTVRGALEQSGLVPVDARALLSHVLGRDRAWLIAHATDPLERSQAEAFFALAKRRRDGEPVAYLVGEREFWGLTLTVSSAVLIPRPETETLVEAALARLPLNRQSRVIDLGTGSGAIALAIAHERPDASVWGTDVSDEALAIARHNAERLGAAQRDLHACRLVCGHARRAVRRDPEQPAVCRTGRSPPDGWRSALRAANRIESRRRPVERAEVGRDGCARPPRTRGQPRWSSTATISPSWSGGSSRAAAWWTCSRCATSPASPGSSRAARPSAARRPAAGRGNPRFVAPCRNLSSIRHVGPPPAINYDSPPLG